MESQKQSDGLSLALETSVRQREKSMDLNVGYDDTTKEWELIVRHFGSLLFLKEEYGIDVTELLGNYSILRVPQNLVETIVNRDEIIYVEKPNKIYFEVTKGVASSCVTSLYLPPFSLSGTGVVVGIVDSGIDYAHPDFRNLDGTTRILALWDQGDQTEGRNGRIYSQEQINEALLMRNLADRFKVVPSVDLSGHGTFVAGVAAGNGRASQGKNVGMAPMASLIVVKLADVNEGGFSKTTSLMRGVDWIVRESIAGNWPVAINLS